jgi:geranylgeranyl diphosphate synthase type II
LADAVCADGECGKPAGRDVALHRPSLVTQLGVSGAYDHLQRLVREAVEAIPPCEGASSLQALVKMQATRLAPKQLARSAA